MNDLIKRLFYNLSTSQIKLCLFIIVIQATISLSTSAQNVKDIQGEIELQTIGTTNDVVPFWMRSNQFGSIPLSGFSQTFIGRVNREYKSQKNTDTTFKRRKLTDWGFGFEARGNVGNKLNGQIIEAYGKARLSIFQLKIGRTKDIMGLNGDSSLSSGNFSVSGNALGIPKIELAINEYWTLPIFNGWIAIKGNFNHGWIGETEIASLYNKKAKTFLHQKSLYGRIGSSKSKLKFYGGFNHQVFWGNEKSVIGNDYTLSNAETFLYVVLGKAYGNKKVPTSKIGNQLGSIDVGVEYNFEKVKVLAYRQNFYDVGALSKLANIRDGLNGISFQNKNYKKKTRGFDWNNILVEFLYTYNQAGESWSKLTKSGDEDYYNNYYYTQGWSYKALGIGTPFITPEYLAKPGQPISEGDFFINNRVIAFHAGIEGNINSIDFKGLVSHSLNYGTFGTSPVGKTTGKLRVSEPVGLFKKVSQFSGYIRGTKTINNNINLGCTFAIDNGGLLNNSAGVILSLSKKFN